MFHHHHHHHHHHHQSGSYELCSSFYTNNPLLYVSHYSEIIVATGYDIKETKGTSGSSLLQSDPLSSRRELVELLDSEPLFDYLIQNGVLSVSQTDHIRAEKSPAKQNLLLLRQVDETGRKGFALFLNALRMTGQHYLANHLDDGDRIVAFNVLQNKTRHIGQVSVFIRASSIRLTPSMTITVSTLLPQDWIRLDDIHQTISIMKQPINKRPMRHLARHLSTVRRSSVTSDATSLSDVIVPSGSIRSFSERNRNRKRLCLLKCFSSLFRRPGVKGSRSITTTSGSSSTTYGDELFQSKPEVAEIRAAVNCELTSDFYGDTNIELKNDVHLSLMDRPLVSSMATGKALAAAVAVAAGNYGFLKTPSGVRPSFRIGSIQKNHPESATETSTSAAADATGCKTPFQHRLTVESLRKLASKVQGSYEAFYTALMSDAALASTRDALVRYLEQERSVLVLETTRTHDGVAIVCICTKSSQLETLWRDYSLERLQMDLEDRLVTEELLLEINALGLRLEVEIGREEIDLATGELTGSSKNTHST